jgi:hypothetical protein
MMSVDTTILQKRVETMIAQSAILSQDVAAMRLRLEEVHASVQVSQESLQAHFDTALARVEQSNANLSGLMQQLIDRT